MKIINGNDIAKTIIEELKNEVAQLKGEKPTIAFVRVGEDPASITYVNKKQAISALIGMNSHLVKLPTTVSQKKLFETIDKLNQDDGVHGILVQSPLPSHISERETFNRVREDKDVDGFNAANLGKLCQEDESGFIACTPAGILELLKKTGITTEGKHVVVLGRSLIVGRPLALLLMRKSSLGNATVTVCHSKTQGLERILQSADIVIAAIGRPHFVKKHMIKENAIVIDVGINRVDDNKTPRGYRLVGDVDFDDVFPKVSKISPVPGGVGPLTVAMLMKNTLKAYKQLKKIKYCI